MWYGKHVIKQGMPIASSNIYFKFMLRMFVSKMFPHTDFLKLAMQKGNNLLLPKRQKEMGGHQLHFGENMPRRIPKSEQIGLR